MKPMFPILFPRLLPMMMPKVLPVMIERGGGSIVYTSSAAGNAGSPAQVAYSMSKSAGQALMRHVARRYGDQGIRANTLAPALTLHSRIEKLVPPATFDLLKTKYLALVQAG